MKKRQAYKFRLKPNAIQLAQLEGYAGSCRFLWNKVLALNLRRLENKQALIWYHEADYWSKLWKSSEEYGFLKAVPAHCLQQKLKDLEKAFKDAFDKTQPLKRMPKFKKKGLGDSIRFPEPKQIKLDNRRIQLPKLGWLGFHKSQAIEGDIRNVTVLKEAGHWYVSIQVEQDMVVVAHPSKMIVGIDVGIAHFASLSNGQQIGSVQPYQKYQKRLAMAQRALSRKQRFSKNWKKQKALIQKLHSKIGNIRRDFLHKLSTVLSKSHAVIVLEALQIRNMTQSAKGSLEAPGKQVKAKSGLNKSILDQGWGEFRRQLAYKLEWLGGVLLTVNPSYTSQQCHACGHCEKANRVSQSEFVCQKCGHEDDADVNAAKNILAAGHAVLACGETGLPVSMKQESLGIGDLVPA